VEEECLEDNGERTLVCFFLWGRGLRIPSTEMDRIAIFQTLFTSNILYMASGVMTIVVITGQKTD
jgi:hypothetical protein